MSLVFNTASVGQARPLSIYNHRTTLAPNWPPLPVKVHDTASIELRPYGHPCGTDLLRRQQNNTQVLVQVRKSPEPEGDAAQRFVRDGSRDPLGELPQRTP